ncbi:MAG: hypothetical protein K0R98_592 [Rickettsiaceae bacterium]|jgi:tetratricopeptide (TPR) repeat protein|nr:hypothetical protein [Rickettsiaceae bacterium]
MRGKILDNPEILPNEYFERAALYHSNDLKIEYYTKAISLFSAGSVKLSYSHYNRGVLYYRKGKFAEAANDFREALTLYKEEYQPYIANAFNYLAMSHNKLGNISDDLLSCIAEKAKEVGSSNFNVSSFQEKISKELINLTREFFEKAEEAKTYTDKIALFTKVINLSPANLLSINWLAGNIVSAFYKTNLADAFLYRGFAHYNNESYADSIKDFGQAVKLYRPGSNKGRFTKICCDLAIERYKGNFLTVIDNLSKAKKELDGFKRCIFYEVLYEEYENTIRELYNKAVSANTNTVADEIALYIKAINLFPVGGVSGVFFVLVNLACNFYLNNQYKESIRCGEQAIRLSGDETKPNHDICVAYNNLGLAYKELRNFTKALECYNSALAYYGDAENVKSLTICRTYRNRATVYNELGNAHAALKDLDKSVELGGEDELELRKEIQAQLDKANDNPDWKARVSEPGSKERSNSK